jgi:hypothetical protein
MDIAQSHVVDSLRRIVSPAMAGVAPSEDRRFSGHDGGGCPPPASPPRSHAPVALSPAYWRNRGSTRTRRSKKGPPEPSPWTRVGCTSLRIRISGCDRRQEGSALRHCTLSSRGKALTCDEARILAAIICNLGHPAGAFDLLRGRQEVFHCIPSRSQDIGERSC